MNLTIMVNIMMIIHIEEKINFYFVNFLHIL